MAVVPSTLEEVQRDVVGKDLSTNPYLQPSAIPTKDNALKTVSKKIIGAINELLLACTKNADSLNAFSVKADTDIKATNTLVVAHDEKIVIHDTKIEGLNTKMTEAKTDIIATDAKVAMLTQEVDQVEENVAQIGQQFVAHVANHPSGGTGAASYPGVKVYRKKVYGGGGTTSQGHLINLTDWPKDIFYKPENFYINRLKEVEEATPCINITMFISSTDKASHCPNIIANSNGIIKFNGTNGKLETLAGNAQPYIYVSDIPLQYITYVDFLTDIPAGLSISCSNCVMVFSLDKEIWYGKNKVVANINDAIDLKAKGFGYSVDSFVKDWLLQGKEIYFAIAFVPTTTSIATFYGLTCGKVTNYIMQKWPLSYFYSGTTSTQISHYYFLGQLADGSPSVFLNQISLGWYVAEYIDYGDTKIIQP